MTRNWRLAVLMLVAAIAAPGAVLAQTSAPQAEAPKTGAPQSAKPEPPAVAPAAKSEPDAKPDAASEPASKPETPQTPAPNKVGAKGKAGKTPTAVEISNKRSVKLLEFEISQVGTGKSIAKLQKSLNSNVKVRLPLKGAKGCEFIAHWRFEDAGDEGQIDLCNDPKIVLTD